MTSEVQTTINWRRIIITGLAYGGGLMLGNIVSQILFSVLSPEPYGWLGQGARLLIGIFVVMFITGIGGAIGGFLGGWTLPVSGEAKGKYGYAWRSAVSVAVVYGSFLLLVVFGLSALTMRDAAFMPAGPFIKVYLLIGSFAGALIGLLLGLTTVGWRRTGSLIVASIAGFGLGGAAFGAAIWAYLGSAPPGGLYEGNFVYVLFGLFALGFFGGLAIGFAYDRLARKELDHRSKPLRPWIRYGLYGLAGLFALWLLMQLLPLLSFASDILTPRAALQTETIAANSVGSHWVESSPLTNAAIVCASGTGSPDAAATDIAASLDGTVMAVWLDSEDSLQYRVLPDGAQGCVPMPEGMAVGNFSLSSRPSTGFTLAVNDIDEGIWITEYTGAGWEPAAVEPGAGDQSDLPAVENESGPVARCAEGGGVEYRSEGQTEVVSRLSCQGDPSVAIDGGGRTHVVWRSDQVEDVLSTVRKDNVLYETIGDGESWSEPMIVTRLEASADHGMVGDAAGNLHLVWSGANQTVHYARQQPYVCDPAMLSGPEVALYEVASLGGYRPEDDVIPFCQNQYEKMVFTPTVDPAFTSADPTMNGAYDDYAALLQDANYEVLFTTMAYEKAVNQDSPGAVLARGVVDLYEKVKANPQDYPRGMLVRLMLGNSPSPSFDLLELDGGLWYVLNDLQEAGLKTMSDPELGWRVEVANFAGRWPHSHVKTLIIDGEMVVASGFNHEYKPLSKDHPSGRGHGDTDTGLVMTGPVAQHSRRIYDQLWTGSILRHCPDLTGSEAELRLTCSDSRGVPDHVPEVMRYSPANDEAIAFSMFRNQVYDEADQQLLAAYRAADKSIDLAQAMFSTELICNLNHFFEVCDFGQSLPYMEALMDAAENGAEVRILLTAYPIQSVENVIAMEIFNNEAVERDVARNIEIRMYDDLLHTKSALIDGEFVIVGSQNLHWSAFGEGVGLSEYSLGVGDPAAAEQYQRFFDYMWDRAPIRLDTVDK